MTPKQAYQLGQAIAMEKQASIRNLLRGLLKQFGLFGRAPKTQLKRYRHSYFTRPPRHAPDRPNFSLAGELAENMSPRWYEAFKADPSAASWYKSMKQ